MRLSLLAGVVVVGTLLTGCGEISSGDCTDKGLCVGSARADASGSGDGAGASDGMTLAESTAGDDAPSDAVSESVERETSGSSSGADDAASSDADSGDSGGPSVDGSGSGSSSGSSSGAADSGPPCTGGDQCTEAPPSGWTGPVQLVQGTPASLSACSGPYAVDTYDGTAGLSQVAAQCTCSCGATATGATCQGQVIASGQSGCGTSCGSVVASATCAPLTMCLGQASLFMKATATTTGGSCGSPTQSGTSLPNPTWTAAGRACALATTPVVGGCAGGQVCAPPSSSGLCIMMLGNAACPAVSSYRVPHVYYSNFSEGRSCSTCTCNPTPGTGSCSGTFTVYSVASGGCSLSTSTFPIGTCENPQSGTQGVTASLGVATQPSCTASGGAAQGSVSAATPTTLCCTL